MKIILETKRLILRTWVESDKKVMCKMNLDPKVMEYFPSLQDEEATKNLIAKINRHFKDYNYTLYAVELKKNKNFIGFIGLLTVPFEASFTPATEVGWRLAFEHQGKGYATEGAKAVLHHAFTALNLGKIVSFTALNNQKSRRVMEKIGLKHNPEDDFNHPKLDRNHPLSKQVLYRLRKDEYFKTLPL